MAGERLEVGFRLDRRHRWLKGGELMPATPIDKQEALLTLARALAGTTYAVIGGVALQVHQREPRTTLDIDLAVARRGDIPAAALVAAGMRRTGTFEHSENWQAADGTPVQFSDDAVPLDALGRAQVIQVGGVELRVLAPPDLCSAKLRASQDPARRRSKRLQDLADAVGLCEEHADITAGLTDAELALLGAIR
ncbi:MAG: hypothetical protein EXR79_16200 [Myxococcales bacterium]|nr:hypothetical protein [Myxococcales bacterium]